MAKANELKIDGCSIYIEQLEQVGKKGYTHDNALSEKAIEWTKENIENAIRPAISIWNSIREEASKVSPDEMEFSMQFEVCLNGEIPILKIVSASSKAEMAVKMKWKKDK